MDEGFAGTEEWLESLRVLAEELNAIPSGVALRDQLIQLLEDWQSSRSEVDNRYTILLSFFLGALSEKGVSTDVAKLAAQMMQAQASNQRSAIRDTTLAHTNVAQDPNCPPANEDRLGAVIGSLQHGIKANLSVSSDGEKQPPVNEAPMNSRATDRERRHPANEAPKNSRATDQGDAGGDNENGANKDVANEETTEAKIPTYPEVERRVNSAYRLHLDRKHGEIEKLQEVLAQKATEAIAQNKEFGALLEIEHAALQQANSVTEIEDMKQILVGGTEEIIEGQRTLAEKLQSSFEYLQLIKSDSERLHDELNKVRLLSLTDEYTGLPNRRAFMRRMEDEIARVQRYNTPLTLVILDLDRFKDINDQYGHPAGDAVLMWYAQNALPMFRHYDMVARYGGEEFGVLFPNTLKEGAIKALEKMHKRIENAQCEYEGVFIDAPTFSAGLTTFQDGDTPAMLIKRADQALYLAKNRGRDRIEMVLPEPIEENTNNELSQK